MAIEWALWSVLGLYALAIAGILVHRSRAAAPLIYGACAVLCAGPLAVAATNLSAGTSPALRLPMALPWLGANFRIDALSAFFLVLLDLGAISASLFAIGHGRHEKSPGRVLPFFPAFIAAMNMVLMADDAFAFLFSWELMSLTSWALVVAHHGEEANRRAGQVYLVMASFGTFSLLLAFGLLAGVEGHYGFEAIRAMPAAPWVGASVLFLALVGAGSKAGLVPLHVWLPLAHPAAPSHVSGLMSGVMTKVALYGFIRLVFDLAGSPQWWWGLVVMAAGGASALAGVLQASFEADMKRILAYSTIENIGFIFVGLGLSLSFSADHFEAAAALALTGALLHALNHSLFKSLLFFGAGAVLDATGLRDIGKMGGLIHRMPVTALAMLGGAMAISALPPFNGFVSEWLTFQAILLSPELPQWGLKLAVPAIGALLALSVALAAACFIRLFGIAFLGRPRSEPAAEAHEVDRLSTGVMLALALGCLALGVVPGLVIDAMSPMVQALLGAQMPRQSADAWLTLVPISGARSSYNGLILFLFVSASALAGAFAVHRFASRALRRGPAWDCGTPDPSPLTQYSPGSFSEPLLRVFGRWLLAAREEVDMPGPGELRPARFVLHLEDRVWSRFYQPLSLAVLAVATRLNTLQFLTIRRYLLLVFAALITLLLVVAIWD
ncbi:MAG: hydrogenase 4 subunit B [Sphingomonadales bacterium]|nr:hydrogenase 4 subunit B [Sphingomonadales bacterium]MDE2567726.1 hydrogenase 4 subunit B [Sphingomonadales bacterium]